MILAAFKSYPITLFAYKIAGEEGWFIEESPLPYDDIHAALQKKDLRVVEVRKIVQGTSNRRDEQGRPMLEDGSAWQFALMFGWALDPYCECWRAPGEPLAKPDQPCAIAQDFKISGDEQPFLSG